MRRYETDDVNLAKMNMNFLNVNHNSLKYIKSDMNKDEKPARNSTVVEDQ